MGKNPFKSTCLYVAKGTSTQTAGSQKCCAIADY